MQKRFVESDPDFSKVYYRLSLHATLADRHITASP